MKFINRISLLIGIFFLTPPVFAEESYSIYLVRHAEKQKNSDDPALTACGRLRAQHLATFLEQVPLKNIYSTKYNRTMATAQPTSQRKKIAIKNYSPKHLSQLAIRLKQLKQNSLIVGHSNTTPQLVELLSDEKTKLLNESDYQALYQIQFTGNNVNLTLFKQPLVCR